MEILLCTLFLQFDFFHLLFVSFFAVVYHKNIGPCPRICNGPVSIDTDTVEIASLFHHPSSFIWSWDRQLLPWPTQSTHEEQQAELKYTSHEN